MLWIIEEVQASKVVLRARGQMSMFILVSASKISPVSLSIPAQAHLEQTLNFQFDVPYHWKMESWAVSQLTVNGGVEQNLEPYLHRWIPLPECQMHVVNF